MPNSLINDAFALLGEAKELEEKATNKTSQKQEQPPSWAALEKSANKYNEACFLMKNHIRRSSSQGSGGSVNAEAVKMNQLLRENIDLYERHAMDLLKEVKGLKLTEQQQQERSRGKRGARDRGCSNRHSRSGEADHERNDGQGSVRKTFRSASSNSSWESSHGSQLYGGNYKGKLATECSRAHQGSDDADKHKMEATQSADKANRLLGTAIDHDESGKSKEAVKMYLKAVEVYSLAIKLLSSGSGGRGTAAAANGELPWHPPEPTSSSAHQELISLQRKSKLALDRVEILRQNDGTPSAPPQPSSEQAGRHRSNASQPEKLTPYEIKVLSWSSRIASGVFLPWSDDEASKFNMSPTRSWLDPKDNALLPLSDKQMKRGCKWARPSEIVAMRGKSPSSCKIAMINSITPYTIKQHCVSDCSFIAGLCISAAFERRFHRRLVSSLIYPQDPRTGMPVYNPHGVYLVKLWLNGVARRVVIDDLLPADERGNLLCSHTTAKGGLELWVPLLEKAYMKLCGGYNFPGSNSGVDLFCLTGWIPERIFFPEDPANVRDFETPVERAWERLYSASSYGDCLITVSTSKELTEAQAEEVGLFTGHAYAVLGVVRTSNGTRLLQLKNPWASQGWKGRFSPQDRTSWSDPAFCAEVGYNASSASQYDDGVFWMSWEDILLYFRNMHMSWSTDPDLFRSRTSVHGYWNKAMGPNDDSFNVGENPQYTITLSKEAIDRKAKLWLLLSRHVTKQEQEGGDATDFLTLHIHRISNSKQRVWYPNSNCVLSGAYTNNQHVLVRYDVDGPEDRFLSIVLSQYKKSNDLGYTLSCYCTEDFDLTYPERGLPVRKELKGSWLLRDSLPDKSNSLAIGTAGGPPGKGSFGSNPQWSIRAPAEGMKIQVKCLAPKELSVNIILARSDPHSGRQHGGDTNQQISKRIHHLYEDPVIDTGAYRYGFVVSEVVFIPAGLYTLVASTFEVGQVGNFLLQVFSSTEVKCSVIK